MCDQDQLDSWASGRLDRRNFVASSVGGAGLFGMLSACRPADAGDDETELVETAVQFPSDGAMADGEFIHSAVGTSPGVVFWPDIAGIRDANRIMARRLAREGYAVLLLNPYYRDAAGEQFSDFAAFAEQDGFARVDPWREKLTPEAVSTDARTAVEWLRSRGPVDRNRQVAVQGYCMTGSFALYAAAAYPEHVRAAASFHGGGLVGPDADSPNQTFSKGRANYLIAIAQNDDARTPTDREQLIADAKAAGRTATIQVFLADHGWCVPDSPAYDEVQANHAWALMLDLYKHSL